MTLDGDGVSVQSSKFKVQIRVAFLQLNAHGRIEQRGDLQEL
jgi:hypothetical protein